MCKERKRLLSMFLSICMALGLIMGVSVHAQEGEGAEPEGFVYKDWFDWETGSPVIHEEATFANDMTAAVRESKLVYLAYVENGEEVSVSANDITISHNGLDAGDKATCTVSDENTDCFQLNFKVAGDFTLIYTGEGTENKVITVHVDYPEMAFYTSSDKVAENILTFDVYKGEEAEFFLIMYRNFGTISLSETPFKVYDFGEGKETTEPEEVAKYITYEKVSGKTGVYKITVLSDKYFGLEAMADVDDGNGGTWESSTYVEVECSPKTAAGQQHEHSPAEWSVTKEATGKAAGLKELKCKTCGEVLDSEVIPKFVVKLNVNKVSLQLNKSTTAIKATVMKGDAIKNWKSSNPKIATVNSKGKITAKKVGKAIITVTTKKGAKASVTVTIQKKAVKCTKIAVDKKNITLKVKKSYQLKVTKTPVTTLEKVTYTSSNKKVATVSKNGKITAKKAGKATITVKCGKKTVKVKVTVKKK